MSKYNKKALAKFIESKDSFNFGYDWNLTMAVVEKIESIIEHSIDIKNSIHIAWWYSPKKTGTFTKGAGGGGGGAIKRTPFDSIFGKFYKIDVYFQKGIKFKLKENEFAKTKIHAVNLACFRWIEWYNKRKV